MKLLKWIWKFSDVLCWTIALVVLNVTIAITQAILITGLVLTASFVVLGLLCSFIAGRGSD